MKVLHLLINRNDETTNRPLGVHRVIDNENRHMSCCWDLDIDEMRELIGGMIFFHRTKTEKSFLGGYVHDVHPIDMSPTYEGPYYTPVEEDIGKRTRRIMFEFEITPEGRQKTEWRGSNHTMSFCGGLVDLEQGVPKTPDG